MLTALSIQAETLKIKIETVKEGTLNISVLTEDGKPCAGCAVELKKEVGEFISLGKTDKEGFFKYTTSFKGEHVFRVVKDINTSELAMIVVGEKENPDNKTVEKTDNKTVEKTEKDDKSEKIDKTEKNEEKLAVSDHNKEILNKIDELDKNINSLKQQMTDKINILEKSIADTKNKDSELIDKIVLGLSYIFGIFGIFALILRRKK